MMSLISGLATSPIYRLHRTWTQVSPKTRKLLEDMQSLMSSDKNFIKYREKLRAAGPPRIPFLGMQPNFPASFPTKSYHTNT